MFGFSFRTLGGSFLALVLFAGTPGCSTTGDVVGGNSRVLTAAQLEATDARTLLEAVQRARPLWLQERSPRSLGAVDTRVLVYFNESLIGTPEETLGSIPLDGIHRIEYWDAPKAGLLPGAGTGHVEGALMVYTSPDSGGG